MSARDYLSAPDAASELGVTVGTLYAYVSRGLIRSVAVTDGGRQRRYPRDDILRLAERKALRRDPRRAARSALQWGEPVLESQVTLIADGRYYYRGRDAVKLATSYSFEDVARLIWNSNATNLFDASASVVPRDATSMLRAAKRLSPIEQFQAVLPMAQSDDPAAYVATPEAVVRTGSRIVRLFTQVMVGAALGGFEQVSHPGPVSSILQRAVAPGDMRASEVLDMALVLLADHELNPSSFAARCVASAGSTPYAVVQAGLAALQGHRHGGASQRVFAMLGQVSDPDAALDVITTRLKQGETIPGFGHRLYPDGDPRFTALFDQLSIHYPGSPEVAIARAFVHEVMELTDMRPNIDLALASMCRQLGLAAGDSTALFAISRTVGWIAQALEQYAQGTLIRPRANYTGVPPDEA